MNKLTISKHVLIYLFITVPVLLAVYTLTAFPENLAFAFSNMAILMLSFAGMAVYPDRFYSLVKMVFIFIFFFFGVVPLNDEFNNNLYWGGGPISIQDKIMTNWIIILGVLSFYFGICIKLISFNEIPDKMPVIKKINNTYFVFISLFVGYLILAKLDFNFIKLMFRGAIFEELGVEVLPEVSQVERLIFDNFIRNLPAALLFVYLCFYKSNYSGAKEHIRVKKFVLIFSFVLFFILVAPTSVPRFQAAALYIPLIIAFTGLWNGPYRMQLFILGSLLVVMPFLDKFREFDPENFSLSIDLKSLNHGHFDAYQNFARVIESDIITSGNQFLGVLLFFVPRSFWSEKPIGSGAMLAQEIGLTFDNISMPFMAEGYVSFGVLGVVAFMFLIGLLLNNLDKVAWKIKHTKGDGLFLYYYYLLFGMVFFVMRGDLMSSFAYTVGLTVSFFSVVIVFKYLSVKYKL